jgi:hypothetical protein
VPVRGAGGSRGRERHERVDDGPAELFRHFGHAGGRCSELNIFLFLSF